MESQGRPRSALVLQLSVPVRDQVQHEASDLPNAPADVLQSEMSAPGDQTLGTVSWFLLVEDAIRREVESTRGLEEKS